MLSGFYCVLKLIVRYLVISFATVVIVLGTISWNSFPCSACTAWKFEQNYLFFNTWILWSNIYIYHLGGYLETLCTHIWRLYIYYSANDAIFEPVLPDCFVRGIRVSIQPFFFIPSMIIAGRIPLWESREVFHRQAVRRTAMFSCRGIIKTYAHCPFKKKSA